MNREAWLHECIRKLRNDFVETGFVLPDKIRASCSWPSKGGLAVKKRRLGEAWSSKSSADGSFEVFISPLLKDPADVSAVLAHELCHCAVGLECKHSGDFRVCAKRLGLEGRMTATKAGKKLAERLSILVAEVGPYPHAELKHNTSPPTQTTRMLKILCMDCGCVARMTRKWLDEVGPPTCACGGAMEEQEAA